MSALIFKLYKYLPCVFNALKLITIFSSSYLTEVEEVCEVQNSISLLRVTPVPRTAGRRATEKG
jgi:hypothetical protein